MSADADAVCGAGYGAAGLNGPVRVAATGAGVGHLGRVD